MRSAESRHIFSKSGNAELTNPSKVASKYERELTGERIRDKVEASKKKGMWMGGQIPLGYNIEDKKLVINEDEAKTISIIYQRFLEVQSVTDVARDMNNLGFRTKTFISKTNKIHGGNRFNQKNIRRILENPLYKGKIVHKENIYDGQHKAIIEPDIWEKVQATFNRAERPRSAGSRITTVPLLKGIMSCGECGCKMTPTYTIKKGKRYRYYICARKLKGGNDDCSVGRLSAGEVEELVVDKALQLLKRPEIIVHTITASTGKLAEGDVINSFKNIETVWEELFPVEQSRVINLLIQEVIATKDGLDIRIFKEGLHSLAAELEAA